MTLKLFLNDPYLKTFEATVTAVLPNGVALDRTAFYATSGGQPGDVGHIGGVPVTDTVKSKEVADQIIHVCDPVGFSVGQLVKCEIDWSRRYLHMRMHTALHLMCVLIKGYATGNQIGTDKSRIDFDVEMTELDKDDIAVRLNALIAADYPVSAMLVDEAELDRNPALVRTLSVQPPRGTGTIRMVTIGDAEAPVDRQPCGGTHVKSTGEIGTMAITKIENKGKQNKRIILGFADTAAEKAA
ncbi:MAG: alanyl-tRNA editing protein [Proteobacteria bacterium]|nr:alanyl-tRNA editing protein [Pseudomonadota bacterium]